MTRPTRAARRAGSATAPGTAASALLVLALLAGCGGSPDQHSPSTTSSPSAESTGEPTTEPGTPGPTPAPTEASTTSPSSETTTASPALVVHADVSSGAVVLDHETAGTGSGPGTGEPTTVSSVPDADTGAVLTLTLPNPQTSVSLDVPAAAGGAARSEADRSAAVTSPDGRLVLGLSSPEGTAPDGSHPPVRWSADDDGSRLVLDLSDVAPTAFPLVVTTHLGTSVVASTSWGEREGGRSLAVTPTDWGRVSGATGSVFAWADLLAADPTADTPGMEEQLQCHLLGAREKATWNLEPWRPAVSLVEYALARCNPT
ncbi:DUF2599 domain-containing protein [Sanguibacter sp. 4.1]|uniref:DUF2599 domain-containing protein n=1 Tax=Sanguibacter biliveldensis TaxID=3030830 RepID=A0AAF0Z2K4_9MICO|nr:DUF2599 domain-containing protein [Sanguibacter sp. 4.1]WPF82060.1 DUF2599 domain-containing protein [Sanguibacter sp. 4.1]